MPILLGEIKFYIVTADTLFLYYLNDIDKIGVTLNNLQNILIQGKKRVAVIRKFGYLFILVNYPEQSLAFSYLTEV